MNYSEMLFNRDERLINRIKELEEELSLEKDKVLELSNHLTLYSSEETMLKENNNLQQRIDKAIEYIENAYEEEYHKPKEVIKTFNLKNCTYEPSLVVLGILKGE